VVAIAAGGRSHSGFSLALKKDGTVIAWGNNAYHRNAVPIGLSNVIAIAAGPEHSLALKRDGTIVGWGSYYENQQISSGLTNVVAISVGEEHCMALKSDGTVVAWGRNQHGETNVPSGLNNLGFPIWFTAHERRGWFS
jgi:alpha-tubulin suppressor-like RCC1 family protein